MAASKKVTNFLDNKGVKYEMISHRKVFTAFDKAKTMKIPENSVGKTLVVKFNSKAGIALIPSSKNLDKDKLKKLINFWLEKKKEKKAGKIDFAKEAWIKKNLKGAKVGAVPPIGSLWKLPTFLDKSLLDNSKIIFSAGDYSWSVKMTPAAFKKALQGQDLLIEGSFSKKK